MFQIAHCVTSKDGLEESSTVHRGQLNNDSSIPASAMLPIRVRQCYKHRGELQEAQEGKLQPLIR